MDSSYWGRWISQTSYRFVRVSRSTGYELGNVRVLSGGTITRNDDTRIKESAETTMMEPYDFGPDFVRIYLDARWPDGTMASEPLGTFLPVVPSRSIEGAASSYSLKMYGLLQELLDDKFAQPYTVSKGENAVDVARSVCEGAGLTVVADDSAYTVTKMRAYGVGVEQNNSEVGDTKLDMVNDLLSLAGFRAAYTDVLGRVRFERYRDPADIAPAWDFEEGRNARFETSMTEERDYTTAANHIVVRYGSLEDGDGRVIVGEAWDNDPASDLSTVSRGRTITNSYSYSELPPGDSVSEMRNYANERAESLLKTAQSVIRRVTFTHTYAPIRVNDTLSLSYPTGDINGKFQVRTQTLRLVGGCPIECEARIFRRRANG